jgi:peptide/nickel transport system substrate-binding protein
MPHTLESNVSQGALSLIYESLVEPDLFTGDPMGVLAESWEVADDGVTWTFRLREGVTWQDGEPFDAEDVKFSFDLYANAEAGSFYVALMEQLISSVDVVDPMTVQIVANEPNSDFPLLAAGPWQFMMAEHVLGSVPPSDLMAGPITSGAQPELIVGTGPFKFVEWIPQDHYTVARYDNYWRGRPHLDEIIQIYVVDDDAIKAQLKAGDIDGARIFADSLSDFDNPNFKLTIIAERPYLMFMQVNMDQSKSTILADPKVRQALMFGLDQEAIAATAGYGIASPALGVIPSLFTTANWDGMTVTYPFDQEQANALLDEAGWATGEDGVREKDGEKLAFELRYITGWPPSERGAEVVQELWRQIGVQAQATPEQEPELFTRGTQTLEYDVILWDTGWDTPDLTDFLSCGGGSNWMKYCNPEVDELLAAARVERDPEQRAELHARMQDIVMTDLPIFPMILYFSVWAVNARVHNFLVGPFNQGWKILRPEQIWMDPL